MRLIIIVIIGLFLISNTVWSLPYENFVKQDLKNEDFLYKKEESIGIFFPYKISSITNSKNSTLKNNKNIFENDSFLLKIEQNNNNLSINELYQRLLQVNNNLLDLSKQIKKEQNITSYMNDSSIILEPKKKYEESKVIDDIIQKNFYENKFGDLNSSELQKKYITQLLKIDQLELAKLSSNNKKELSILRTELLKKRNDQITQELQELRSKINTLRKKEEKQVLKNTEIFFEKNYNFPSLIRSQLQINYQLLLTLNKQAQNIDLISAQQRKIVLHTIQIHQALITLREQSKLFKKFPIFAETLRSQISNILDIQKSNKLDCDMAQLCIQKLRYEIQIQKISQLFKSTQDNDYQFTPTQRKILESLLITQRNLLNSLLTSCDTQFFELTKLKIANNNLEESVKNIQESVHSYLFFVADVNPIRFSYILDVGQDLKKLLTKDTFYQFIHAIEIIFTNSDTIIPLFGSILLVIVSRSAYHHYYSFLERSSNRVGKVNQDNFSLTLQNVFWSILVSLPLPVLWAVIGNCLQNYWTYPLVVAIGEGINTTVIILWIFILINYFAHPKGLFIRHFGWSIQSVKRAFRYYSLFICIIILLIIGLITFNNYNDKEFFGTIGRLFFILLCAFLSLITNNLKHSGFLLYKNKNFSTNNVVNRFIWNIMIFIPIFAAIAACLGYLNTAKILLARFEKSLAIWFLLLVVYHIIRRWMFIQRRRIAFERAKQKRAEILAQRARNNEEDISQSQLNETEEEIDEKILNLDTISYQSLQLVRSILIIIALLSVIFIWSELHSTFGFLDKIQLWDTSSIQGSIQPITLGSIVIVILIVIITTQMVRNLPAFLELAILQHLDLTPGTGYAITTLTKYGLMLLASFIGFSLIGIEWSKLQWLVAALGVGLGFGLQEIFANFISGLMILFEKPIRIGDTVTIRNSTGNITRINTRATTITDWDKKEIIVPNKAFITEQFVNWSLSDTITRIVLNVPAPTGININKITHILMQAAHCCPLVLENPAPEAYLVDLQQGIPLFELRMYAAEIGHRMPLRHHVHALIIESYRLHGLILPFPPFQLRTDQIKFFDEISEVPIR